MPKRIVQVRVIPDPKLKVKCKPVEFFGMELRDFIGDMIEAMLNLSAHGIAANQFGLCEQIAVMKTKEGDILVLVNPKIFWSSSETIIAEEQCLSVPNKVVKVERYREVQIDYQNSHGEEKSIFLSDEDAIVAQHELDHLEGILITDHAETYRT